MCTLVLKRGVLAAILAVSGFGAAHAATVNIVTAATNPQETKTGIRADTATFGRDLAGMTVTAAYDDGTQEVLTWEALPVRPGHGLDGEAAGADVRLFAGDTYNGFQLTTTKLLSSLKLQAAPANSIFDMAIANDGALGDTPSTKIGFPLEIMTGGNLLNGVVTASYSGIVNLAGRAADGDAYTDLFIDFSAVAERGLLGYIEFRSDMDTLEVAGDLVAVSAVPLSASFPLLAGGIAAFGLLRRRKLRTS
ncbi:VPLPA-CTERM sorting domain-containing protein [Microbulbifer sp. S227A]|uniref:VPLPA-CTERM sorting domain-containing protein n=1 Tax=Microbulbifer sp. S227A TaxID=3415131 RepID=UPI003C7AD0CF